MKFRKIEDANGFHTVRIARRHNTRRNRASAWVKWWWQDHERDVREFNIQFGEDVRIGLIRMARQCEKYIAIGGTAKMFSAATGIRLRKLNHARYLDRFSIFGTAREEV